MRLIVPIFSPPGAGVFVAEFRQFEIGQALQPITSKCFTYRNRPGKTLLMVPGVLKVCPDVGAQLLFPQLGHFFGCSFLGTQEWLQCLQIYLVFFMVLLL
jgi:hypothetical protein